MILRVGLVFGAVFFVQELGEFVADNSVPTAELLPEETNRSEPNSASKPNGDDEWLTDGVKLALRCTYEEYRDAHYEECVDEPSLVYEQPNSEADDTTLVFGETRALLASVE